MSANAAWLALALIIPTCTLSTSARKRKGMAAEHTPLHKDERTHRWERWKAWNVELGFGSILLLDLRTRLTVNLSIGPNEIVSGSACGVADGLPELSGPHHWQGKSSRDTSGGVMGEIWNAGTCN